MIIDMRIRPPFRSYCGTGLYKSGETETITKGLGFEPAPSVLDQSMPHCLQEMAEAGIVRGVVPGRCRKEGGSVSNEDIIALVQEYPEKFIGLYGVDTADIDAALAGIEKTVVNGPLKGVSLEPGLGEKPLYGNDRSLFPIYDFCGEHNIPVAVMIGGRCGPDMSYGNPNLYLHMATSFPKCKFIITHGGWPFVPPALGPWFWAKNIYIQPDMYFFNCPGMKDYILAANHYMQDNFLFATGYPYVPLAAGAKMFADLVDKRVVNKLMYENAARIFGL